MEWLVFIAIGICVLLWLASSSGRQVKQHSVAQSARPDTGLRDELEKARQERNECKAKLTDLRGQLRRLKARNEQLESRVALALDVIPVVTPPEWVDEYGLVLDRKGLFTSRDHVEYGRIFRAWATSAIQTWEAIDALSSDSRRSLEEACRATLRDETGNGVTAYAATPLVTETVKLLQTAPDIIKVNLFELKSADLQRFALWLDIFQGLGRERYFRLREHAKKLAEPLVPLGEPESETLD